MKLANKVGALTVLAAAMLASGLAQAQETPRPAFDSPEWADRAWYIGTGIGRTQADSDDAALMRALTVGTNGVVGTRDDRDVGYKFYFGKQMGRTFAWELGYFDLGEYTVNAVNRGTPAGNFASTMSFKGVSWDVLAQLPLSQRFSIYGRLGLQYGKADLRMSGTRGFAAGRASQQQKELNAKAGIGMEFKFTEALAMRVEGERYKINDPLGVRRNIDHATINLVYKLGRPAAKAPVVVAPPPPPPAPAPAPVAEPPAPPAPPTPVSEKVTFNAQALFDFDKAVVKPEGRAALDDLLNKLQGMNTEVMVTVGHTDSIGSDAYNQKLSIRRAEAVKAYLVSKGVEAGRVYTEGKGETQPVADNKTAEGRQQNRRVTVEVVGNRTVTR